MVIIKSIYAIQQYQAGCKDKDLASIIPAQIAEEHNVGTSSILAVQANKDTDNIPLQTVKISYENNMTPAEKSFKASKQQASVETQQATRPMDTTNENIPKQHYKCSGKGSRNVPTTLLKINYINKVGYFCDSCTRDLLHGGLATKIGDA